MISNAVLEMELMAYEDKEAATKTKIVTRIAEYPDRILCIALNHNIIGFINSACAW